MNNDDRSGEETSGDASNDVLEVLAQRRAAARRMKETLASMTSSMDEMKSFFAAKPQEQTNMADKMARKTAHRVMRPIKPDVRPDQSAQADDAAPVDTVAPETVDESAPVLNVNDLQSLSSEELIALCTEQNLLADIGPVSSKHDFIAAILREHLRRGGSVECEGYLDSWQEGFGVFHTLAAGLRSTPEDVTLQNSSVQSFSLRPGDLVRVRVRPGERSLQNRRGFQAGDVITVNGTDPAAARGRLPFASIPAETPSRPIAGTEFKFGERVLVPVGDNMPRPAAMIAWAETIAEANPSADVWVVLLSASPETSVVKPAHGNVRIVCTEFEDLAEKAMQVAGNVTEIARRTAETARDSIVLVDSLSALVRAYGLAATTQQGVPSDGIDGRSAARAKRLFGAGRALANGGSVTVIATISDIPMNERIVAEFTPAATSTAKLP